MTTPAYLIKYVLTDGVIRRVEIDEPDEYGCVHAAGYILSNFKLGIDVVYSKADARKLAEKKRRKKLARLEERIAELRAMTFEVQA